MIHSTERVWFLHNLYQIWYFCYLIKCGFEAIKDTKLNYENKGSVHSLKGWGHSKKKMNFAQMVFYVKLSQDQARI